MIRASLREKLEPLVELIPICPELEIGLGVPRDPVILERREDTVHMVQPTTGRDLTRAMSDFAERFLDSLDEVDGFILKSRSPSCAVRDGKVGDARGPGLFATRVLERFPEAAVEDEVALQDSGRRERFLARVFALAAAPARARWDGGISKSCPAKAIHKFGWPAGGASYTLFTEDLCATHATECAWPPSGSCSSSASWPPPQALARCSKEPTDPID